MKCALVGSRFFGASVFEALRQQPGVAFSVVVAPAADDRLALAAQAAGVTVHVQANPKLVPGEAIPEGTELIVAAHTHARVSNEALARSRLGGVGYHPSLLPRHRGIAAVEWTILQGDPIAGGSVYHLADGWDAGAVAAQDWCFVAKGESARSLWERALAPMGLALLTQVVRHASEKGALPSFQQDERFATKAPLIRRPVVLAEGQAGSHSVLVVTLVGDDRPGIVSQIADLARRFGANWEGSRMANLAGEFAGMVQLDVPRENAAALAEALRGLEASGLRVLVAEGAGSQAPAGMRGVELELIGDDRVGLLSQLTALLAGRGISVEQLQTEIVAGGDAGKPRFKVQAYLLVPKAVSSEALHQALDALAGELVVDIALGERHHAATIEPV